MRKYPIEEASLNVRNHLQEIQIIFDEYQKQCFVERSSEFFCLELNGEAGELANLEKKAWKGREVDMESFCDEAADVLIAIMNYSNAKKIDLGKAVRKKLTKIEAARLKFEQEGKAF